MTASALPATFTAAGREIPVELRRTGRARRLTLTADAARGLVRLTAPRRAGTGEIVRFFKSREDWIAARVEAFPHPRPFAPDAAIPFAGGTLILVHGSGAGPLARREGGRLHVAGGRHLFGGRVERWLRGEALKALSDETLRLTASAGLSGSLRAVSVGDPRRQWGSCARAGDVRYSWRLILAPPVVLKAVVAHEVAHLRHHDHGEDFHALAGRLSGGTQKQANAWLRAHGASLHWIGRQ